MKRLLSLLALGLAVGWMTGCPAASSTTPPAAIAPGYSSQADQTLGQSLAALCSPIGSFVAQEKINYAALTPAAQATEKPYLNSMIAVCNVANATYSAFHATPPTATLAQAQTAFATAQSAQTALEANKGVK